jgi:hypothetical protein
MSAMASKPLADRIRHEIDTGGLPALLPDKIVTGLAEGAPCAGCGEPIVLFQVEHRLETPEQSWRLHLACAGLWRAELHRRGMSRSPSEPGR